MFVVIAFHPTGSLFCAAFGPGIDAIERLRHRLYALDRWNGVPSRVPRASNVRKPANRYRKAG